MEVVVALNNNAVQILLNVRICKEFLNYREKEIIFVVGDGVYSMFFKQCFTTLFIQTTGKIFVIKMLIKI